MNLKYILQKSTKIKQTVWSPVPFSFLLKNFYFDMNNDNQTITKIQDETRTAGEALLSGKYVENGWECSIFEIL